MRQIELRSDTQTKPTAEMRRAMYEAEVGDDVSGEDPTVNKLEEVAAELLGKEAALFVTSGTMGNIVSVMTHVQRGDEILLESQAHIYFYEVGGLAALAQAIPVLVQGRRFSILHPDDVKTAIRAPNIHYATPRLLCLENTHNRGGGTVMPPERMAELKQVAESRGMAVHLDGARVFNAAVALGTDVKEITKHVDSVQVCLSKGLCAPVGSVVAAPKAFIDKARKNRKMLGGGMRQAGVIAAAGLVALTKMASRLAEDHAKARVLAEGLANVRGIDIDLEAVQTNIVSYDVAGTGMSGAAYVERLRLQGVRCGAQGPTRIRMVCHNDVSMDDVKQAVRIVDGVVTGKLS
jgi:threonine aldolase